MPRTIHRCNTPDGPRYREWSSIVDAYTTAPMTRDEMVDYLTSDAIEKARREADERLFRADHRGTSQYDDTRSMDAWDTERCGGRNGCGRFHHAFQRHAHDGLCGWCGEAEGERSHGPPCEAKP